MKIKYFCPGISLVFLAILIFTPLAKTRAEGVSAITTIFPLKEFAETVGGERVKVRLLLPPGAEPHTWEPKPSDIIKLSQADFFIYMSGEMEPWVGGILKSLQNSRLRVIEVSREVPINPMSAANYHENHHDHGAEAHGTGGEHEGGDPHVWLDFEYDQKILGRIAEVFAQKDPGGADYYRRNAQNYKAKLRALDQRYKEVLSNCESREFILGSHAAFFYLANRYGLKQVPLYGVSPNAEPTPKKMAEVISLAKKHGAKAIFFV